MIIETTINIDHDVLEKISRAAIRAGVSRRDMISSLLRRLSDDHEMMMRSWERVRYQERNNDNRWKCLHVVLWPDEYEFFLDLRKAYKQSISRLIAYAVEKYLDEVINYVMKNTDNNRYKNYVIVCNIIDGVVCWGYYWGVPRTLLGKPLIPGPVPCQ